MPFETVSTTLARILGFTQSVHTLERNQRESARPIARGSRCAVAPKHLTSARSRQPWHRDGVYRRPPSRRRSGAGLVEIQIQAVDPFDVQRDLFCQQLAHGLSYHDCRPRVGVLALRHTAALRGYERKHGLPSITWASSVPTHDSSVRGAASLGVRMAVLKTLNREVLS